MVISKEIMEREAINFLSVLFTLPEIEKLQIKDVTISSINDRENIRRGIGNCYHDKYSDIDINVYLKLNSTDYNAQTPIYKKYLSRLGLEDKIFGIIFQERVNDREGLRICLKTGIRIDFTCFCSCCELAPLLEGEQNSINGYQKENEKTKCDWDLEKVDWFWFVAVQALGKLMRKDYLISSHLAHTLIMEVLVAQMVMRDNKYNSNFHRWGYSEELEYLAVDISGVDEYKILGDQTNNHIAELIYRAVISYDKVVFQLNEIYKSRAERFFEIWKSYVK